MELTTIFIIIIVLVYATKNTKGKQVVEHCGNTMVHLAASADKASAALERQCDELLSEETNKDELKAKLAKSSKAKKVVTEDYDDAE